MLLATFQLLSFYFFSFSADRVVSWSVQYDILFYFCMSIYSNFSLFTCTQAVQFLYLRTQPYSKTIVAYWSGQYRSPFSFTSRLNSTPRVIANQPFLNVISIVLRLHLSLWESILYLIILASRSGGEVLIKGFRFRANDTTRSRFPTDLMNTRLCSNMLFQMAPLSGTDGVFTYDCCMTFWCIYF